jgi:hypothetical protein
VELLDAGQRRGAAVFRVVSAYGVGAACVGNGVDTVQEVLAVEGQNVVASAQLNGLSYYGGT